MLLTSIVLIKGKYFFNILAKTIVSIGWIADLRYDVLGTDGFQLVRLLVYIIIIVLVQFFFWSVMLLLFTQTCNIIKG